MNGQQENELINVLRALATAQIKQAEAINRLAEADETLYSLIARTLADETEDEPETYLDGTPRR